MTEPEAKDMRFVYGLIIAGIIVIAMNVVMLSIAFDVNAQDSVVDAYENGPRE